MRGQDEKFGVKSDPFECDRPDLPLSAVLRIAEYGKLFIAQVNPDLMTTSRSDSNPREKSTDGKPFNDLDLRERRLFLNGSTHPKSGQPRSPFREREILLSQTMLAEPFVRDLVRLLRLREKE